MDSELYGHGLYEAQVRSAAHSPMEGQSLGTFVSDGLGYASPSTQNTTGYQSNRHSPNFRQSPHLYDAGQGPYPNILYPESSQRTGSTRTASLGPAQDAGSVNHLSKFDSNRYEATFELDTPQLSGTASGNSNMFDHYGASSFRNTSISDHRTPPSPPTHSGTPVRGSHPSNTHAHSHPSRPSSNPSPLYPPAMSPPPHGMTSYHGDSSSSHTPPLSLFPNVHPTPMLTNEPGFDGPSSSPEMNFGYGDPAQQHRRNPHSIYAPNGTPSMSSSIPMSTNAPVNRNSGHNHEAVGTGVPTRAYPTSLSASSASTPTLPTTALGGGDGGRLLSAAGASAVTLSQCAPYGSVRGTSASSPVTPPLDIHDADPGSKMKSNSTGQPPLSGYSGEEDALGFLRANKDGQSPVLPLQRMQTSNTTSNVRPAVQEATDSAADGHLVQPPTKKKKKSKMHTCEICSKKFPRPSGLRTHMNTHNNARPYACGFPGCTRTFGVRSNAKRHLRTHGIVPPPSNASNNGEGTYIVGFSPPVIAPTPDGAAGMGLAPDGSFCVTDGIAMVDGEYKSKQGRTPFFKLRWMPPSLTSRTNAAKLKSVDEVTGEVSEEETDSEEGGEEGEGSDGDYDDRNGDGLEDERDNAPGALDAAHRSMFPPSLGGMSMPTLMGLEPDVGHNASVRNTMPPTGPSRASSYSSAYSISSAPSTISSHQGCICPFSPCLSNPCRTLNGASSYSSSPAMDHSTISIGAYAQTSALRSMSMPDFTMGSLIGVGNTGLGGMTMSGSASSTSANGMDLGFGGVFASSGMSIGTSNLYARRVAHGLSAGHRPHLLASA